MCCADNEEKIVQMDMDSLYLGNLNTVEFDIRLPKRGNYGSKITWKSGDTRFINEDGGVKRPQYGKGKRVISLYATFQYGYVVKEKIYQVTVLEEENKIKISKIFPIQLHSQRGKVVYLPSVAVIETKEQEVISHSVSWEKGDEQIFDEIGTVEIKGVLVDTVIPVTAKVTVELEDKVEKMEAKTKINYFKYSDVSLIEGTEFKAAQNRTFEFLMNVNDDEMLYNFRKASALDTLGAMEMIGWDSPESLLRGHTTGHYLSALALCYATTVDSKCKEKAEYMVYSLEQCQIAFGKNPNFHQGFLSGYSEEQFDLLEKFTRYPEIWAPYYTLHKILAGLLDCYNLVGIKTALKIADKLGDWVYSRLSKLSNKTLKKMWGIYIAGEFGGINDSLAELYKITKKHEHLIAAKLFDNDRLFFPMKEKIDALGGLHANQHIPQILGALKIFEASEEKRYYDIALFFWQTVINGHIYSIGGTGEGEMFHKHNKIGGVISDNTAETCASYNMLKLTKELYLYNPTVDFMDYYERTMFNHILASGDCKPTGGSTYFMPLAPGHKKSFDFENSCCHGTGMENHFKYPEAIYFYKEDTLFVNIFVSSCLNWRKQEVQLTQTVDEANPGKVKIKVKGNQPFTLKIRKPYWCINGYHVEINRKEEAVSLGSDGYLSINRSWSEEDEFVLNFDCRLRLEATPDKKDVVSLAYGPYILVALSEEKDYLRLPLTEESLKDELIKAANELIFYYPKEKLTFIPLSRVHHEAYHAYFMLES